ncbi:MAG: hypothetical protein U0223_11715 [Nitrospira sp.]|nr:hypothetical protein [Nitrospira sp.]
MTKIATALGLLLLPAITLAWSDPEADGKPRNSWERQQETYRQHGYDTYRNGPLEETRREEARRQEKQREEDRQRQEQQRSSNSPYKSLYPR